MVQKLIEIVATVLELSEDVKDTIKEDTDLMELGLDSMTCVEMVVNLEDEFGITVDEEDLLVENMASISALVQLVEKYQ
ncbi:MAG: acyl carrier protein [Lachnospiraceae bacterium]|nr:acyl carrier protein [Lachnospiraceae bacterium]MBQ2406821.1 acyl carrier protein [Lachnospiraceae bacterium]MBQ5851490.1 acyl carrier protein [Lachnospiraceae bacterium]MEE0919342.1 acyl carrier protein [Lachnospiraceae bacterium]